ncbi:MAG: phosphatase PAP2 family protein [Nanoarchaeota archaeon]|nr:phosphatase PAP2 family protein [Nanoarchaeota archaeon]
MQNWINKLWKNEKIIFILFILQITVVYKLIQIYFSQGIIFKTVLDDKIPFIPEFVIPYLLFIIVLSLPFILTLKNKKDFLAISRLFLIVSAVCNLTYIFFQTTIIRPEIISSTIFDRLVLFVYSIDSPLNLFPSEHVTFSVLSTLCLFKINRKLAYIILPFTALIVISTLFIKQHHIPDVLAGLMLAFLGYWFIFKRMP